MIRSFGSIPPEAKKLELIIVIQSDQSLTCTSQLQRFRSTSEFALSVNSFTFKNMVVTHTLKFVSSLSRLYRPKCLEHWRILRKLGAFAPLSPSNLQRKIRFSSRLRFLFLQSNLAEGARDRMGNLNVLSCNVSSKPFKTSYEGFLRGKFYEYSVYDPTFNGICIYAPRIL